MKIIKYGAEWCGPCRATSAILKESGLPFEEIDVDENEELADAKKITTLPYIEFYSDDDLEIPKNTHTGMLTKETLDEIVKTL